MVLDVPVSAPAVEPEEQESRHGPVAQLLISWSPLSVILVAYAVAGWVSAPLESAPSGTNRLGLPLQTTGPEAADRWLFGTLPSAWLQERLVDGSAHWYDAVAALVYATHVVGIPVLTTVVWFLARDRFRSWVVAVVAFTVVGMAGYVLYPATPPWMGSASVERTSALGWEALHLGFAGGLVDLLQGASNTVAAMPSLHAGAALLLALFAWPSLRALGRTLMLAYAGLMALTLVYTGEHFVVDVLAGWAVAVVAVTVARAVAGRGSRSPRR